MRFGRYLPFAILAAMVIALQLLLAAFGVSYYLTQLTRAVYYSIVVLGLCLLMGYAGQISLGHAGFFAIGGYASAFLTTWNLLPHAASPAVRLLGRLGLLVERQDIYGTSLLHVSPWLGLCAALAAAAAVALLIGLPVIRLRGHYLAMATLGFGIIIHRVVVGMPALGEADGISEVPPFHLFGPLQINGQPAFGVQNYYIAWAAALAVMILAANLVRSRAGRALRAIHENEEAARALGVPVGRYKLGVFVFSAVAAALAGSLLTHYVGAIGPSEAAAMKSVRYVAIVAAAGMANLWGALVMGIILNFLSLRGVFGSYDDAVFGLILISIMLFAPQGIVRLPRFLKALLPQRHRGTEKEQP